MAEKGHKGRSSDGCAFDHPPKRAVEDFCNSHGRLQYVKGAIRPLIEVLNVRPKTVRCRLILLLKTYPSFATIHSYQLRMWGIVTYCFAGIGSCSALYFSCFNSIHLILYCFVARQTFYCFALFINKKSLPFG